MIRFAAALALAMGLLSPAAHALIVDAPGAYTAVDNPGSGGDVQITIEVGDNPFILQGLFATWSGGPDAVRSAVLTGSGLPGGIVADTLNFAPGFVTAGAFADAIELQANSVYTVVATAAGQNSTTFTFEVTEVPLPAGLVLLGTAVAGLGLVRRMRAAA
jgi:hypothetical protein